MIKVKEDLTGKIFGRLKVLGRAEDITEKSGRKIPAWACECQCKDKTITIVRQADLRSGHTKSCGCLSVKNKSNSYDITGEYGIGYTSNTNKEFYFDLEDYGKIKSHTWHETEHGYLSSNIDGQLIYLHTFITGYKYCDHKNRNRLDNRKENLRESDYFDNAINKNLMSTNKSGIAGVSYITKDNRWQAIISRKFDKISLGQFKNKEEAIRIRLQAEYDILGIDLAPQKHLFKQYNIPDQKLSLLIKKRFEERDNNVKQAKREKQIKDFYQNKLNKNKNLLYNSIGFVCQECENLNLKYGKSKKINRCAACRIREIKDMHPEYKDFLQNLKID